MVGCRNSTPDNIISPSKMEDILYDYHLAQAMGQMSDSADYETSLYSEAVFRKYGITQADFDNSMEFYSRHADELFKIYQKLNVRYGSNRNLSAASTVHSVASDTSLLWTGNLFNMLNANGDNHVEFDVLTDTTVHAGSQLIMRFSTQWIYHEGEKSAILNLTVHYRNDSTMVLTRNIFDSGEQVVSCWVGNKPVRSITGFIYQATTWSERPKLLLIRQPELLCVNPKLGIRKKVSTPRGDSLHLSAPQRAEQRVQDSILRSDNEKEHQNHFQ